MGVKNIRVVVDDFDGKELPEETVPIRVRVGRLAWNLYLSEANERKLQGALAPFVKDAETANLSDPAPRLRHSGGKTLAQQKDAKDAQRAEIEAFAKSNKLSLPGIRGRIRADLLEAYYKSNPKAERLFG